MTKHLPDYDGRTPDGYRLTFKGAADNLTDALELDGEVVLIVRGKVKDPSFKTNQFGVMRLVQSVSVDFAEVADEVTASRLMAEIKRQQDEQAGQESFDDDLDAAMETEGADG
jgi:DNA-binding IscR family transcriptional regulator